MTISTRISIKKRTARIVLLLAALILLHFMFVRVGGGYPLTIAPFAVILFLYAAYRFRFPKSILLLWLLLISLPFLNFLLPGTEVDVGEFMKTYLLWAFAVTTVLYASRASIRLDSGWVSKAAFLGLVIITVYSAAQVGLSVFFQNDVLYNPWGNHQYLNQYAVEVQRANPRAPGFYLEPSFNAFMATSLLLITIIGNYRPRFALVLGGVALIVTKAFSGLLIFGFIVLGYLIVRGNRKEIGASIAVLGLSVVALFATGLNDYILFRIGSLSTEGTSTYYRMVAPLEVLWDVLRNDPTGLPLGTTESTISGYSLAHGTGTGTSLDNGLYILVFYFGWMVVILAAFLVAAFFLRGWESAESVTMLYVLGYIFLSLFYSGAIFNPEYIFMMVLIVFVWRSSSLPKDAILRVSESVVPPAPPRRTAPAVKAPG